MPCSFYPVVKCLAVFANSSFDDTFHYQVLGEAVHITSQYLTNEEKVVVATSKAKALEAKSSGL